MPTKFPYLIINAFTRSSLGGNPAIIVLLPPGSLSPTVTTHPTPPPLDTQTMIALAQSFAQPITVFFSPPNPNPNDDDTDRAFDIRFFAPRHSPVFCGHGIFATTKAICSGLFPGVREESGVVTFRTAAGMILSARAIPIPGEDHGTNDEDSEFYAIELPLTATKALSSAERNRVHNVLAKALGKDPAELGIDFTAQGVGNMANYLMIVLDGKDELEGREVDANALLEASPFVNISISHPTPGKDHAFVSRVFIPECGIPEDHVCGSAHTLMVPYYGSLPGSGMKAGEEIYVRQVSPRGGDLWVTLDEQKGVVVLRGNAKLFAQGELLL